MVYDFKLARAEAHCGVAGDPGRRQHQGAAEHARTRVGGLTLDRYGHLYGSDVEAVGVAINALLTRKIPVFVVTVWARAAFRAFRGHRCGHEIASDLLVSLVEPRGFEPLTSALQRQRSTN